MIEIPKFTGSKQENYMLCKKQIQALIAGESNLIANLSNVTALLNQALTEINWVGFYLYEKESNQLVLGPFQGLPACIRIPLSKGVCGIAAQEKRTYVVQNVNKFPGHIACDAKSQSEIVIPLIKEDKLIGVLDIDSPVQNRFTEEDKSGLETIVDVLIQELTHKA